MLCAARWALTLPPEHEDRCYAWFAAERLDAHTHRRDLLRLARRLEAAPGPWDPVEQAKRCLELAAIHVRIFGEADVERLLGMAVAAANAWQKPRDVEAVRGWLAEFRRDQGLLSDTEVSALTTDERVAHACIRARRLLDLRRSAGVALKQALSAATDRRYTGAFGTLLLRLCARAGNPAAVKRVWARLPPGERSIDCVTDLLAAGHRTAALAYTRRFAETSLAKLKPAEWNLHHPAGDVARSVAALVRLGKRRLATSLLERASAKFDDPRLDTRGFASAGAYVALANAWTALGNTVRAELSLWDAQRVAITRTDRQIVLPDVVDSYARLGKPRQALALARKVEARRRAEVTALALVRAGRRQELAAHLATLTAPAECARMAWAVALATSET
jgi:hypothetical protein